MSRMGRRGAVAGPRPPANLTVNIAGTTSATAATAAYTFPAFTASVTAGGSGGPYTYVWVVTNTGGSGSWSVTAGQGTASGTIQASGATPGTALTATLSVTITETASGLVGVASRGVNYTRT